MLNPEILLGISLFTSIVLALVLVILLARAKLVSSQDVSININGERTITAAMDGTQQVFTPRKSHDRPVVFDPLHPLQPLQADFSHDNQDE